MLKYKVFLSTTIILTCFLLVLVEDGVSGADEIIVDRHTHVIIDVHGNVCSSKNTDVVVGVVLSDHMKAFHIPGMEQPGAVHPNHGINKKYVRNHFPTIANVLSCDCGGDDDDGDDDGGGDDSSGNNDDSNGNNDDSSGNNDDSSGNNDDSSGNNDDS